MYGSPTVSFTKAQKDKAGIGVPACSVRLGDDCATAYGTTTHQQTASVKLIIRCVVSYAQVFFHLSFRKMKEAHSRQRCVSSSRKRTTRTVSIR